MLGLAPGSAFLQVTKMERVRYKNGQNNGQNRDTAGRFTPGNPGGPGRPIGTKIDFKHSFNQCFSEADICALAANLKKLANAGSIKSLVYLVDRLCGPASIAHRTGTAFNFRAEFNAAESFDDVDGATEAD